MLARRRWLAVLVPIVAIGVVELASDTFLDPYLPFPWDTLTVVAAIAAATIVLALLAFRAIDRLAGTLQDRNAELERRNASIDALQTVGIAIAGLTDLDAIVQTAARAARELLDADAALLVLAGPDGTPFVRARAGDEAVFEPVPSAEPPGDPEPGRPDVARFVRRDYRDSLLAAGIRVGGETIGTLAVAAAGQRTYGADQLDALSSLATQAGLALENDRLQRRLRELAVRGERARIARELHDGLAQVLAYVNAKSQAAEQLIDAGRDAEARAQLSELGAAARSVYVDVREAILGLASPVGSDAAMLAVIRDYARAFAEASKLAVEVTADSAAAELRLDPTVEGELVRIVEEALTNVRNHADAARVDIDLRVRYGCLRVDVADDGRGLDLDEATAERPGTWPRYGLRSMRDRAGGIGAEIAWRRADDRGTVVEIRVPLEPGARPAAPG